MEKSGLFIVRWLLSMLVLGIVLYVLYRIFEPFLAAMLWASVLVVTTYPGYRRLARWFPKRQRVAAFLMTALVGIIILGLVLPLVLALGREVDTAIEYVNEIKKYATSAGLDRAKEIPFFGHQIETYLRSRQSDEGLITDLATRYRGQLFRAVGFALKNVAEFFAQFFVCLFVSFFLYLHGRYLGAQLLRAGDLIGGKRFAHVSRSMNEMIRAAVYGMLFTALAQGILAGIGYVAVGAPVPLLLSFLTMLASLIPFGTPLVYIPVAIGVVLKGAPLWYGIGLAVWGISVVSVSDNIIRPLFISKATNMPIILIFFAVLGGVMSFGMLGVFLGPVFVAVGIALWNEFISEKEALTSADGG